MNDELTDKSEKPSNEDYGDGDPPPLIKYIIWLLRRQNWQKHWKAIVLALVIIVFAFFIPKIINFIHKKTLSDPDKVQKELLLEEQSRSAIRKALNVGDVATAIRFLSGLDDSSFKYQECEHIFESCIKNRRLNEAEIVVNECWDGDQRKEKLARIKHEQLKQ